MVRRRLTTYGILLTAALLLLTGCHKELVYEPERTTDSGTLVTAFDWRLAPEAAPRTMRQQCYGDSVRHDYEFVGRGGGSIALTGGGYGLLCYNGDTETILSRGNTYATFELYTRTTEFAATSAMFASTRNIPRAIGTEEQEVILEPDPLWTGCAPRVTVTAGEETFETVAMQPATQTFRFIIRDVSNLAYVSNLSATLSGVSCSMSPATGRCSDTQCIIAFDMGSDGDSTITGSVRCMGHCPDTAHEHKLVVYAILRDGTKWYYTIDVTGAVNDGDPSQPIVLSGLPFPKPITNGSGLHPAVDVWQPVQIDIHM